MPTPVIRFKDVTKIYGSTLILDKVTLDINAGEIFGVIGASGSGKTTLLSTLIGFVPIESGEVLFNQEQLLGARQKTTFKPITKKAKEIKRMFGFASQSPSFYSKLTVYENMDYFGTLYGLSKEERKANISTLLGLMELKNKQDTLAENLSGGMQRRLDIACAMMHDPKVLILDEPTADLDPFLRKHILKLIKKINKKGTTIILSSHNLAELESLCTRIGIIHKSRFLTVGTPEEIKRKFAKNEQIHLETYPGNYEELIKKLKDKEIDTIENRGTEIVIHTSNPEDMLHKILHAIEGSKESLIDVRLSKPSLDEVFLDLSKGARQEEKDKEEKQAKKDEQKEKEVEKETKDETSKDNQ